MWIINILSTENRRVIHKKDGACRIKSARPEPRIYGDFPGHDVNNTRYVENFQNKCGKTYQHLLTLQNSWYTVKRIKWIFFLIVPA